MKILRREPPTLTLGKDLTVNRLGYGAMHLTGPGFWGPPADPEEAVRVLRRAVDLGVDFIDTADSYGPDTNEQIIRRALHPYPEHLVIATKGGMLRSGPQDWIRSSGREPYIVALGRPEYLRQQVEMSLRNLGLERIDLYQLHRIDPAVPFDDQIGELARLKEEGKIRHIGLSGQPEVTVDQLTQARLITDIVAVENLYNIADQTCEDVLRYAEENDIAFIPWFPMGHGDLTGPDSMLTTLAKYYGASPAQLALAWLLHHSPNILLIPGTSSVAHLEENLQAANIQLDGSDISALNDAAARSTVPVWRPSPAQTGETMTTTESAITTGTGAHPNVDILRAVYADLTCLGDYASDDVVLHGATGGDHVGKQAVVAKERELIHLTGNTLLMDVQHITANDYFGAVLGILRAHLDGDSLAMPFCGLWRFRDGVIVEHWENGYDASVMVRFFTNHPPKTGA
jgi:pyridoxine 4-dehydrogenase